MFERLNLNLTYKLLFSFLFLSVLAITVQILSSYWFANKSYYNKTMDIVMGENNGRKVQMESFFHEKINNLQLLSSSDKVTELYSEMEILGDTLKTDMSEPFNIRHYKYISTYNKYINYFTRFINIYDFDDLYLIDGSQGHVYFSVQKLKDLGANLAHGRYRENHLSKLWRSVVKSGKVHIQDFEVYEPLKGKYAMFIGVPVLKKDRVVAVLVALITEKHINQYVSEKGQLGNLGESYFVGFNANRETELRSKIASAGLELGRPIESSVVDAALKKEETGFSEYQNEDGNEYLVGYSQLRVRNLTWGVFTSIPKEEVYSPVRDMAVNNLFAAFIVIFFIVIIGVRIAANISKPIIEIKNNLLLLSQGVLPKRELEAKSQNEIGQIQDAFNRVVVGMRKYVDFADKIGRKQLDAEFEKLSEEDILGNSLLVMQKNLKTAEEESDKRQLDERKQRWTTEGIAKFGDILRQNYTDMTEHSNNIIQNLVSFLDINQGGIFLYNDNEHNPKLNLIACFAYDRQKFIEKEIAFGEGLVGACFSEKETIYLTNIPDDYANISSGLGSAKPKSVLIVPLKMDVKTLGVIELVSFDYFEEHIIAFVEKIAENIASSIHSSQINVQTQKLLEESRMQSEQMAAQEEEMRQNMEELQATQEESERREAESNSVVSALKESALVVTLSLEGTIIDANEKIMKLLDVDPDDFIGQQYRKYNSSLKNSNIIANIVQTEMSEQVVSKIITASKEITIMETYSVIKNSYDEPIKVIVIGFEIV